MLMLRKIRYNILEIEVKWDKLVLLIGKHFVWIIVLLHLIILILHYLILGNSVLECMQKMFWSLLLIKNKLPNWNPWL